MIPKKKFDKTAPGDTTYIINPNLGRPYFVNIDSKLKKITFQAPILFASIINDLKSFRDSVRNALALVPIFEYKWKLRDLLNKAKEYEKKKSIWKRIKAKIAKKKIKKELASESAIEKQLKKLRTRAIRGDFIVPNIYDFKEVIPLKINDPQYLDRDMFFPQGFLFKHGALSNSYKFYGATIEFELTKEILDFLKDRMFVMFDISLNKKRINYHSIVISKNDWKNMCFVHATDLHLAERNDKIYGIIKKWTQTVNTQKFQKSLTKYSKKLKNKTVNAEKKNDIDLKSLIKRLINPNNQFRRFIKQMNKKVRQNQLDFVVLTGDIIDYTLLSRITKKIFKTADFSYENTNWQVFRDIITNYPFKEKPKYLAVARGEELLCPIITVLGNHDFRVSSYDLNWGGMYKKMGLNAFEAISLNDMFLSSPIDAITKSYNALRGYWTEINASLDFSMKLGNNIFIFLNSGPDAYKNVRDFMAGHPSVTGLTSKQIKFLENIINKYYTREDNIFLFLHGPPINTGGKRNIVQRISKIIGKKDIKVKISDFKETLFGKQLDKHSSARIDGKFNVKYGTISTNWEKLIEFCKDYTVLTLAGHTHKLNEYRLADPQGEKTKVYDAPPFIIKKIENPAAIFHDLYSEIYNNAKEIAKYGPFIVQTPALGLGSYGDNKSAGAYREIIIKNGKLESFKIHSVNNKE
ncbi:MAG: metallophosphoesterase [Candidatus Lokiarchaeota archaeon]|nr:metallophosphoesterase [Candidatus Lokiarchaeota archaeon]